MKQYIIEEQEPQMVSDTVATYTTDTIIPVHVPTLGKFTMEELVRQLTSFALTLVKPDAKERASKQYSPRIMRLHANSSKTITKQDMEEDERLAYLLSK